ncbi:MAG: hypothetical protein HY774_28995 [Acidobacteria bacterium]|nr:hypothetical protein [Acidobacteriota bacterium]
MKYLKMIYAVARREVIERRTIFALALVVGLMAISWPFVFGFLNAENLSSTWPDMSAVSGLFLGLFLSFGVAFLSGVGLFGRDLSEKRIGFYFSRPIPALALWTGKILAGWTLIIGSFLVTLTPTFLVGANPLKGLLELSNNGQGILLLLLPLLLFGIGLMASIAFRSRSRWLVFDLVAIPLLLLLLSAGLFPLYRVYAEDLMFKALIGFGLIAGIGMLLASAISTIQGRTSLIQTHRVISLALCTVLLIGAGSVQVYARWALAVTPADIESVIFGLVIHPNWVLVGGTISNRERYYPTFLYNIPTGQMTSLEIGQYDLPTIACSKDGQRCAWIAPSRKLPMFSGSQPETGMLTILDSTTKTVNQKIQSNLEFSIGTNLVFSPDGKWLVAASQERVEFIDFQTRRITNQLTVPFELQKEGFLQVNKAIFVSPEVLRLYRAHPKKQGHQILEFNLTTREFKETGFLLKDLPQEVSLLNSSSVNGFARFPRFCDSIDRAFISLPAQPNPESPVSVVSSSYKNKSEEIYATRVFDSRTGQHLFSLPAVDTNFYGVSALALSDKRTVQLVWKKGVIPVTPEVPTAFLQVFSADGILERTISLEKVNEFQGHSSYEIHGETSSGKVLLLSTTKSPQKQDLTKFSVIDCTTGEIQEKSRSHSSFQGMIWWYLKGSAEENETRLFLERPGRGKPKSLIYFNPETGEKRTLIGAKN